MSVPQADKDEIVEGIRTVVPRVAAAVRSAPDASKVAVGRWTIGHVAAHLASSVPYFESLAAGDGVPVAALSERSDWNEQALAPLLDEPLDSLADAYEAGLGAVVEEIAGRPADREVPWLGGIPLAMTGVAAIVLCEALVHGHDVSAGKGWEIDPAYARQALLGLVPTLPLFITEAGAKLRATFELSLRAPEAEILLVFDGGTLSIEAPRSRRVDCHISADPSKYLLVGYGRISQWGPILTGRMVAWGRKPWLARSLAGAFQNP